VLKNSNAVFILFSDHMIAARHNTRNVEQMQMKGF